MGTLEKLLIDGLLHLFSVEQLNNALSDPRTVAIIIGAMVAVSGAWLGIFLMLRKMSMTSDAISHTVLLGIVVAFIILTKGFNQEPDLSSIWLIIGAAASGVLTVFLTELVYRSGVVKADSALGLIFPFLFAIAVILVSRYVDKSHLDTHAVFVGEIGVAWSNTNSYCFDNCEEVTITPNDERAEVGRECSNCATEGINPRDPKAEFIEVCANCGTYSAAEAWQKRLTDTPPELVFWPKSLTTMGLITLLNMAFVTLLYKELKLTTFDGGLAAALGFRPGLLNYLLMMLVSVTAVGAFDAVGSILVIAFFIIPAATAYILTERLWVMLVLAPIFGALGVYTGYNFSRGDFLGIYQISNLLKFLDRTIGLDGYTTWNTSISASMVIMTFVFFLLAWVVSPRYGLVSNVVRRALQRRQFRDQLMLMHIANHQNTPEAIDECTVEHLPEHLHWSEQQVQRVVGRLRLRNLIQLEGSLVKLTERGHQRVENFTLHYIHS